MSSGSGKCKGSSVSFPLQLCSVSHLLGLLTLHARHVKRVEGRPQTVGSKSKPGLHICGHLGIDRKETEKAKERGQGKPRDNETLTL